MVRGDSSGSTEIFTSALSAISSTWNSTIGLFSLPTGWPSTLNVSKATGNSAICLEVLRKDFSIGYAEVSTANLFMVNFASIINKQGVATFPNDTRALQSAMVDYMNVYQQLPKENFVFRIVDGPGVASYPLVGFTYLIFKLDYPPSCDIAYEVLRYFLWGLTDPQASSVAKANFFSTIPSSVQTYVFPILADYTCPDGTQLLQRALFDITAEQNGLYDTWLISAVAILASIILFFIILTVFLTLKNWHQMKTIKGSPRAITVRMVVYNDLLEIHRSFHIEIQYGTKRKLLALAAESCHEIGLAGCNWSTFMVFPTTHSLQLIYAGFATHCVIVFFGLFYKMYDIIKSILNPNYLEEHSFRQRERAFSKTYGNQVFLNVFPGQQNPSTNNLADIHTGLLRLRHIIVEDLLQLVSLTLSELPLSVLSFVAMFMFPYTSYLIRLCFCWNMISTGIKLKSIFSFFASFNLYTKGRRLVTPTAVIVSPNT